MRLLDGIDYGAFYAFQANKLPLLDNILTVVAELGSYPVLALVVLAAAILLVAQRRHRELFALLGCVAVSVLLVEALKWIVQRPRPQDWTGPDYLGHSFPSASAMLSAVVYFGLALLFTAAWRGTWKRKLILAAVLGLVLLIGFSLMCLRYHFVSDVLAGWLGAVLVLLGGKPNPQPTARPQHE